MKTKIFYITILYFIIFLSCSKDRKEFSSSNSVTIETINKTLASSKKENNPKVKKALIDSIFRNIQYSKNSKELRNTLSDVVFEYYFLKSFKDIDKSSQLLLQLSKSSKDSTNLAVAYRSRAFYFNNIKNIDSSFNYYLKAEKIYSLLKDKNNYANVLLNKGLVQYKGGDNLGAELSLTKAYNIFSELKDDLRLFNTLIALGNVADELNEYEKSIVYYSKALDKAFELSKTDNVLNPSICYNNLGFVYIRQKNYNKAMENFKKGLKNLKVDDDPDLYASLVDNLAYCKMKTNDFTGLPQMFFKSLKIRDSIQSRPNIILSNIHLSQYFYLKNDKVKAIAYANKALFLSEKDKNPLDLLASLHQAAEVDSRKAIEYNRKYITLSDSLQVAERKSKDRFARIQLETDEIIQENQGLAEKNRNLLYVFVVTFILVVLLFVVRAQRARTRELLYKQAQQKANEDIYNLMMSQQAIIDESRSKEKKRLAQDLHDGVLGRMFGLRLNLDSLNSSTDEEAVQKRFELLNELKTIEQDIREISHDLNREKQVLINNFVSIVHNLLEEQKNAFDAEVNYTIDNTVNWDKIGNAIKINLYRILQEGLQNINKYANAKNISVEIKGDEENVYLKIKDDGVGFDVNRKSKGIGMQNMISRTHDCKGIIDITSKKDEGTKIVITIPIETKQPTTIPQE
ncbi:hypothetical protein GCM10022386_19480 [Flavobacterium cheonhonense]|uniref:histidine kinase n=1 Tax=Flavobacterium cheonhonense TaxID=706185 RepID=A0ABP7U2D4_9FLAO|nr:sensor histidine kinase [Flavobacterium cheonhonense]